MKDLVEELLSLHKTAQRDRAKLAALQTEHDSILEDRERLVNRCQREEQLSEKLQDMLASRNNAVAKELGLHTAYHKSLQQLSGRCSCHTYACARWMKASTV